jgi:hypothetical protein
VAHEPPAAVLRLEIGMLSEVLADLGLNRLGQQGTRSTAQDLDGLILECSWLISRTTLCFDTAYRSFGGKVRSSSNTTTCRLPDSIRHQLPAIAQPGEH